MNPFTLFVFRGATLVTASLCVASVSAQVLVNDTFSDNPDLAALNGSARQNQPDTLSWFVGGAGNRTSTGVSGALVTTRAANNNTTNRNVTQTAHFSSITLAVGDSLSLNFNFTLSGVNAIVGGGDAFRFGLFNSGIASQITANSTDDNGADANFNNWTGYSLWTPSGGNTTAASLRERTGTSPTLMLGGANTSRATTAAPANSLVLNTPYVGTFNLLRTNEGVQISASLGGLAIANYLDATSLVTSFDSFHFFASGVGLGESDAPTNSFTLDNVQLTYTAVPEPSTFATLAGLGVLGLAASRRRRLG